MGEGKCFSVWVNKTELTIRYTRTKLLATARNFAYVEVSKDEAQGYIVRVGDLTYQRIIEPHKIDGEITFEAAVNAFASFAEEKVVALYYCSSAQVPEHARKLIGGNTPPEMHIYVECVSHSISPNKALVRMQTTLRFVCTAQLGR